MVPGQLLFKFTPPSKHENSNNCRMVLESLISKFLGIALNAFFLHFFFFHKIWKNLRKGKNILINIYKKILHQVDLLAI